MRSLQLAVILSAALAGSVAGAASAAPTGSQASFGCKVLQRTLSGTPAGKHLKRFVAAGANACVSDSGGAEPWRALIDLGLGSNHARAACKVLQADQSVTFRRLTKAASGADLACVGSSSSSQGGRFSITAYFDKGRWSGMLGLEGPNGGASGSSGPPLLKKVTAQLPR